MERLQPFPLGTLEFNKTYKIRKNTYHATTYQNFKQTSAKTLELHQVKGEPLK